MKHSAGFLIYKYEKKILKIFIVHPGGPYWKNKEEGAWSIPKGEIDDEDLSEENMIAVAKRELKEETGIDFPSIAKLINLGEIVQRNDKTVHAWAFEGDWSGLLQCTSFVDVEWPPKSGKKINIPEVDKGGFFSVEVVKKKINSKQIELVNRLVDKLKA